MRVLYPSNFGKLTSIFRAHTNAYPLLARVIDCASLKAVFLVVPRHLYEIPWEDHCSCTKDYRRITTERDCNIVGGPHNSHG